jgi:hypothetical protein
MTTKGRRRFTLTIRTMMVFTAFCAVVLAVVFAWHRARLDRVQAELRSAQMALYRAELHRAQERLLWSTRMFEKGYVSGAQLQSERLSLQKAEYQLERTRAEGEALGKDPAGGGTATAKKGARP